MWQEFLDAEWFQSDWVEVSKPVEGWTIDRYAEETVLLPLSLIKPLAQPNRLNEISLIDKDLLDDIEVSLAERGFDTAMVVVVDDFGRIVLKDGHHRLIAALRLRLQVVPVRFQRGKKINTTASSLSELLPRLLLALK